MIVILFNYRNKLNMRYMVTENTEFLKVIIIINK